MSTKIHYVTISVSQAGARTVTCTCDMRLHGLFTAEEARRIARAHQADPGRDPLDLPGVSK